MTRCIVLRPEQVVDMRWRVLRSGRPRASATFEGDKDALHHGITLDNVLVGVVSLFESPLVHEHQRYALQLRGMAVAPEHQGQGIGAQLLEAVVARAHAPLWCNARLRARSFYLRAGWRPIGELFELPDVGPHQRMIWAERLRPWP